MYACAGLTTLSNDSWVKTSRIQFSLPMRFLGGPGMLRRTSLASLDFFMMTSLSRNAVCMRRTSIWLLLQEMYSYNELQIYIHIYIYIRKHFILLSFEVAWLWLVNGQVGNTYKFSHSLPQHVKRDSSVVNYTWAPGNLYVFTEDRVNITPTLLDTGYLTQISTHPAGAHGCVCFMCSSRGRVEMKGNSRFHVEEVFACLRVHCTHGQPLVCTLILRPASSAPCGPTGGSEACRTSRRGGLLTVDQLNLFRVGHSHRLRDGHRDVTAWQGEGERGDTCQYRWAGRHRSVGNHWAASEER